MVEYQDVPVRFVGTRDINLREADERSVISEFLLGKNRKKDERHGLAKELFLSLTPAAGLLKVYPRSGGGQVLSIALATISSIANIDLYVQCSVKSF
jgi:hypothetical protein